MRANEGELKESLEAPRINPSSPSRPLQPKGTNSTKFSPLLFGITDHLPWGGSGSSQGEWGTVEGKIGEDLGRGEILRGKLATKHKSRVDSPRIVGVEAGGERAHFDRTSTL